MPFYSFEEYLVVVAIGLASLRQAERVILESYRIAVEFLSDRVGLGSRTSIHALTLQRQWSYGSVEGNGPALIYDLGESSYTEFGGGIEIVS